MRPLTPLILLILLCSLQSPAQDSLVRYKDLKFSSELEKKAFDDHFLNGKTDCFSLLMANGILLNDAAISKAKTGFTEHLAGINNEKFAGRKNDKKVKFIYDDLHKSYLTKYELKNRFEEIFKNGYYNCVSASSLFGLAFTELKIPFAIVEIPTHVYVIAYPDHEGIKVETTTPVGGFFNVSESFKLNYVKMLKDQKIISAQEFNSKDVNEIFNSHYYGEQNTINLVQLAGVQYMNDGIYKMDEDDHAHAVSQFEKAYLLYPSERASYLLYASTLQAFTGHTEKDEIHATYLAKLSRHKKLGISTDVVMGEFSRAVQQLLFDQGQNEKLQQYYNALTRAVSDSVVRTELGFYYNYEYARFYYNKQKYKDALPFAEACLRAKPSNQDGVNLLLGCLTNTLRHNYTGEAIGIFDGYAKKFPVLMENNGFVEILGNLYLSEFDRSYRENDPAEGEKYRGTFETFSKSHPDVKFGEDIIANAYSSAAVYYFRKGQNSKARSVITKGLEISPNNYELQMRKKMIN
jgi:tetratricopeptide (TPR) repeat protein